MKLHLISGEIGLRRAFAAGYYRLAMSAGLALGLLLQTGIAFAQIDPGSSTIRWVAVSFGPNNYPDPSGDQQTGSAEGDIVGNAAQPSLYMNYASANGSLGFRLRVGADVSPTGFKGAAFVGLDANLDGVLDLFIGVNNQGSGDALGIWNPGTGLNTSPSTTTLVTSPIKSYTETSLNYRFQPVTAISDPTALSYDLNADGKADQFLSFILPFADIASALSSRGITGFTPDSPMRLVAATATQANTLNQDLNGPSGGNSSSLSWAQLGSLSQTYAPNGVAPVPEPSSITVCCAAGLYLLFHLKRQRRG